MAGLILLSALLAGLGTEHWTLLIAAALLGVQVAVVGLVARAVERIGRDFRIEDTIARTLDLYVELVGQGSGVPAGR